MKCLPVSSLCQWTLDGLDSLTSTFLLFPSLCKNNDDVVEKYRNFLDVDDQEEIIPDLWRSFGGDDDG